jgi:beta-lactamase class D
MMRGTPFVFFVLLFAIAGCAAGPTEASLRPAAPAQTGATRGDAPADKSPLEGFDLAPYFRDVKGTFVILDLRRGRTLRHDEARARERFPPFSTFKVPNSLIGLETGVIRDANFEIKWDPRKYPRAGETANFASWWQDQTLRTAMQRSAVWYYRELASRVGEERMGEYVRRFRYGNEDISGGLTRFWLGSSLKISADEQVEFLRRLVAGELPVSGRSAQIVRDIITLEATPAYKLSGKTGSGPLAEERFLGWLVGYLEAGGETYVFATQIEGPNFASIRDERLRLTKQILAGLKLIPQPQT